MVVVFGKHLFSSKFLDFRFFMKNDQDKILHPLICNKCCSEKKFFRSYGADQPIPSLLVFFTWGSVLVFRLGSTLTFSISGLVNVCAKFRAFITICTIVGTQTLTINGNPRIAFYKLQRF